MKIMFIIHSLNYLAGAETILSRFANFFSQKGHEVSICLLSNEKILFNLNKQINLYPYHGKKINHLFPKKIDLLYQQVNHITASIEEENPDILISYISATNILSTIAAKITKKPIILAERSSYHLSLKNRYWKFLRRIVYPFATKAIILTHEDQPKYHYVKEVIVIPNPLILENKHHSIKRKKIVLAVGRLAPVKGFDMLIKAFSKLDTKGWKLVIAGEGRSREELQNLIDTLKITDKVSLIGVVKDVEYYYKKASIFVLSSRSEGFPGALCEAMGYGCPPIAFNCPTGPKEIITHNKDGILIKPNNIKELEKEIHKLINDQERREQLGQEAQKISKKLDIQNIAQQWEEILTTTIKNFNKDS